MWSLLCHESADAHITTNLTRAFSISSLPAYDVSDGHGLCMSVINCTSGKAFILRIRLYGHWTCMNIVTAVGDGDRKSARCTGSSVESMLWFIRSITQHLYYLPNIVGDPALPPNYSDLLCHGLWRCSLVSGIRVLEVYPLSPVSFNAGPSRIGLL